MARLLPDKSVHIRPAYNDRLFSGGLRGWLHGARFEWLRGRVAEFAQPPRHVIELGCYDGRALDFLSVPPLRYDGFDAGWEGGLRRARERFAGCEHITFHECRNPDQMNVTRAQVDLALALETLEHIPDDMLDGYLAKIADALAPDGVFLVTLPVEKGPVFAVKHAVKAAIHRDAERYSVPEYIYQSLGITHNVARDQHKGFDYAAMIARLRRHFRVEKITGIPFSALPPIMNFGVGILCRGRRA